MDDMEQVVQEDTLRLRVLPPKALERYQETCGRYIKNLDTIGYRLQATIADLDTVDTGDQAKVQQWLRNVTSYKDTYEALSEEYLGYLKRIQTKESLEKYNEQKGSAQSMSEAVMAALDTVNLQGGDAEIQDDQLNVLHHEERVNTPPSNTGPIEDMLVNIKAEKRSVISGGDSASLRSKNSTATQKRAKAEAARTRLEFAKKEAALRKKAAAVEEENIVAEALAQAKKYRAKAEFDAELSLLAEEKEMAAADAEASFLESEVRSIGTRSSITSHSRHSLPVDNNAERTRQFVASLPDHIEPEEHNPGKDPTVKSNVDSFTSFLLKKDMLQQRLYQFNDEPQSFDVWRASFRSVIEELNVKSFEELDLLVKHLGKESSSFAQSIRASNTKNPDRAVKLIWQRLEERYGRPEMIEHSLKTKLEKFPVLSNKENRKLYDLCDLLDEILSAKEDPRYAIQFAVFDSSRGVNSIVSKLPFYLQQKWVTHASQYKKRKNVPYPPFSIFVQFIHDMCEVRNDPAFNLDIPQRKEKPTVQKFDKIVSRKTEVREKPTKPVVNQDKDSDKIARCPIHNSGHLLSECREFALKTWDGKRAVLKNKGVCYKCLASSDHMSAKCPVKVSCEKCQRNNHTTVMHREPVKDHGGEPASQQEDIVNSRRTVLLGGEFKGQSCGKIVLVDVFTCARPTEKVRIYALLDDQSNRSLIAPELCDKLRIDGEAFNYTLSSCSGRAMMSGQRVAGVSVQSLCSSEQIDLPELIECNYIPQDLSEIPTPEIAKKYSHLEGISPLLHPLDPESGIHLLIGRDVPVAHHVKQQIIGAKDEPFAQELPLGWVVIGKVCLGKFHQPELVHVYKTNIGIDGRSTVLNLCENFRTVSEHEDIFHKSPDDNKIGLSADDREFIRIMDAEITKDSSGQWIAPLPFKEPKEALPNNRSQVLHRAKLLDKGLRQNSTKQRHMLEFMDKVFRSGAAEIAEETDKEKWYLPLFGIYHPRKPNQIRGVFDSSVVFEGKSLNEALLSGPNLTNSIVGVLLRFRSDEFAVSADIEQMFYRFLVTPDHRRFLRFFWYKENNPELPLIEYQMRVHVFGNRPSPAVATFGLRHTVRNAADGVRQQVQRNFYVDDAFSSHATREEAIGLLSKTQSVLKEEGAIRLHKIASNDVQIMNSFPKEDLSKDLKDIDLDTDSLPQQLSLGLRWDLQLDVFQFLAPDVHRSFSRRGMLSAMNSVYDPLGFLAPFSVSGKLLLREVCSNGVNWDDDLPSRYLEPWNAWNHALHLLDGYQVPRMFIKSSLSLLENPAVHLYTDASEKGIAAVAYLVADTASGKDIGFIMGKAKVAPKSGHSIPRLELCGAVLGIELAQCIVEHLDISPSTIRYFTDSTVVLGYIHNKTRRFYTYVSNRVARIHDFSQPDQWTYIQTELNPADVATRSCIDDVKSALATWHSGPSYILQEDSMDCKEVFALQDPDADQEIRPEVVVKVTSVEPPVQPNSSVFEGFSSWKKLVAFYACLIHVARTVKGETKCGHRSWHICGESHSQETKKAAESLVIAKVQEQMYPDEIRSMKHGSHLPKESKILALSPYLDENGLLRLGGRINRLCSNIGLASVNPVIVPKSHIARLLVRHYHELVLHQGRHFTEGSLRSNGFWIVGAKKLVSSVIGECITCRKLRGPLMYQRMSDLPEERLNPGPPFTSVGIDVFGPWEVVTRKTRGGAANSKRWSVLFTCMTTRATHIEVIEDMSSSCFLNALSRMISIRGPVNTLWSDRGTNFVGAATLIKAHVINVEEPSFQAHLKNQGIVWHFNSPHSSHMGGVWERPIGIARRILESMLVNRIFKDLSHEVLCTFMYEVAAVMNSRPLIAVDCDAQDPLILSPNMLLTQKQGCSLPLANSEDLSLKDMYTAQWKRVQMLSDMFWKQWRTQYLNTLQTRRKWQTERPELKVGDLVLVKDTSVPRYNWPVGIVDKLFPSKDGKIRKCEVRIGDRKGGHSVYTRPVTELVMLLSEDK